MRNVNKASLTEAGLDVAVCLETSQRAHFTRELWNSGLSSIQSIRLSGPFVAKMMLDDRKSTFTKRLASIISTRWEVVSLPGLGSATDWVLGLGGPNESWVSDGAGLSIIWTESKVGGWSGLSLFH